jgi:hypothetical protein
MIVNVSFDSSVNSAPTGFVSTVNAVAQFFGAAFSDNVTINISVGFGEVAGQAVSALGESITQLNTHSYAALRNALLGDSKSADDSSAAATLPGTTPSSGATYWVPRAEAKALGLLGASSSSDGSIGFSSNAGIFDYDRTDGIASGRYDFFAVVAHELTEVMGRQLMTGENFGGHANSLEPMDLFHYSSAGVRSFVGTQAGYFSADGGTTNLDNFNINPGGDFGDWAASAGNDAFLAFGKSGVTNAVSDADLRVMDVLGWDRVTAATPPRNPTTRDLDLWKTSNGQWAGSVDIGAHPAGYAPAGIGDFNNDGTSDVLWFNATSGDTEVWLIANGHWSGSVHLGVHPAGWTPAGIGDFNHDGTTDIAWRETSTNHVETWLLAAS